MFLKANGVLDSLGVLEADGKSCGPMTENSVLLTAGHVPLCLWSLKPVLFQLTH